MPIKLIAMDIDGTLLDSEGLLPVRNKQVIAEAAASGIDIVIVTGRRFQSARKLAAGLECELELIVSNGSLIKSPNGDTHYRRLLPAGTARSVLEATEEFRNCAGVIFDRPDWGQVFFEQIDWNGPFIGPYLRKYREQVEEIQPLTRCLDAEDPVEVMFVGECEAMRQALQILQNHHASEEFTLAITEYKERGMSMLDVLKRGVSKGEALAEWARRRGIRREEVMAIGDNWNDREMLEYAGLPVVMANAVPELKSLGWSVTLSNDECGVAHAIEQFALGNRRVGESVETPRV